MSVHILTLFLSLFAKKEKPVMDSSNVDQLAALITASIGGATKSATIEASAPEVGTTAGDIAQEANDVGAATGTSAKVETAVEDTSATVADAFGTLASLHIVNSRLAEKGTSIAEIIAAVAKAFLGIHL